MSASLVGSEMCIRDSALQKPSRSPPEALQTPSRRPPDALQTPSRQPPRCLLYTSDAADDM
eukprot:11553147-Alexandrium_andersonii.AAC.1